MALKQTINILEYVPYTQNTNLKIDMSSFGVPLSMMKPLETLRDKGVTLAYDGSKTQGIDIINNRGSIIGNVKVFGNNQWLEELCRDLRELAKNTEEYGL